MNRNPVRILSSLFRSALRGRSALVMALTVATLASGCIVNTTTNTFGTLEVQWSVPGGCDSQGIATVRVRSSRGSITDAETSGIACNKGFQSLTVSPGVHTVTIEGFSTGGALLASASINSILVEANASTTTPIATLTSQGNQVGLGTLQLAWTINGQPAASACGANGLTKVHISLLDSTKQNIIATAEANCASGGANMTGVPTGTAYVQLDGATAAGVLTFGNPTVFGPVNILPSATTFIDGAIDLVSMAAVVSLDWQFQDGGTCGSHGAQFVLVEVSDLTNGTTQVVVPMSDPWAKKPCDIGPNSNYDARVIDMQFATPTCTIPTGAKGLVVCGITGTAIGVRISVIEAASNTILYGGNMQIKQIPAASHVPIDVPLYLAPCNTTDNICGAP